MPAGPPADRIQIYPAGAPKNQETEPALGHSRGSFCTQIHILADRRGRPLRVTGGQCHDRTQARALGEAGTDVPLSCLITDRAYDREGTLIVAEPDNQDF